MKLSGGWSLVFASQGPPPNLWYFGVVPGGVGPPPIIQDPPPLGPYIKIIKGWVLIFYARTHPPWVLTFSGGGSWGWVLDL